MAVTIYGDNVSGDKSGRITSNNPDGTRSISLEEEIVRDNDAVIANTPLPAEQDQSAYKFLGSSFSGADIRCLVHMYDDPAQVNTYITRMENDRNIARRISQAADLLAGGGLLVAAQNVGTDTTYAEKRKLILSNAGFSNISDSVDQEASQAILGVTIAENFFDLRSLGTVLRTLENMATVNRNLADSLDNQLANVKELEKQSSALVELATLQTISVQSHREKFAVRACGNSYAKGYTRGPRTIAGSMIFTVFHEHALAQLIRRMAKSTSYGERDPDISSLIADQLPPLDMTVVMANEYGQRSVFRLFGLEFVNDGVTYSIEDLLSENVITWVARDMDVLEDRGNTILKRIHSTMNATVEGDTSKDLTATQLINTDDEYQAYLDKFRLRRRLKNR